MKKPYLGVRGLVNLLLCDVLYPVSSSADALPSVYHMVSTVNVAVWD